MELITVVNWMGALQISSTNITAFLREMKVPLVGDLDTRDQNR